MKTVKVTLWIELNDDAKTNWIEQVIQDNLELDEAIVDIEIEDAS